MRIARDKRRSVYRGVQTASKGKLATKKSRRPTGTGFAGYASQPIKPGVKPVSQWAGLADTIALTEDHFGE
jgi:hypothetical protein